MRLLRGSKGSLLPRAGMMRLGGGGLIKGALRLT